jgi:hypothetical protein
MILQTIYGKTNLATRKSKTHNKQNNVQSLNLSDHRQVVKLLDSCENTICTSLATCLRHNPGPRAGSQVLLDLVEDQSFLSYTYSDTSGTFTDRFASVSRRYWTAVEIWMKDASPPSQAGYQIFDRMRFRSPLILSASGRKTSPRGKIYALTLRVNQGMMTDKPRYRIAQTG